MFASNFGNHCLPLMAHFDKPINCKVTEAPFPSKMDCIGKILVENVALGMGMRMRYEAGNCAIVFSIRELSNDVLKMIVNLGHIFVKNHTRPKATIHGFSWGHWKVHIHLHVHVHVVRRTYNVHTLHQPSPWDPEEEQNTYYYYCTAVLLHYCNTWRRLPAGHQPSSSMISELATAISFDIGVWVYDSLVPTWPGNEARCMRDYLGQSRSQAT